jgi:zinc-ribbon domain
LAWLLTVFLVVLVAAYVLFLFILYFVADVDQVDSIRSTAAFLLIVSAVAFGALLFAASGTITAEDETGAAEDEHAVTPDEAFRGEDTGPVPAEEPGCPNCGQMNPPEANFCNHCGHRLADRSEGETL